MAAQAAIHVSRHMREYRPKRPCVYLLASRRDGVLYAGATSDLVKRVSLHKQKLVEGFTQRYGVTQLVYYEMHETMDQAIRRESQIKKWKVRLIEQMNPEWTDLFDEESGAVLFGPAGVERERS